MQKCYVDALIAKVYTTLFLGSKIAILGWKASLHCEFTRKVAATDRVLFYENIPSSLPTTVKLALSTWVIGHSARSRLERKTEIQKGIYRPRAIKQALEACTTILFPVVPPLLLIRKEVPEQSKDDPLVVLEKLMDTVKYPLLTIQESHLDGPLKAFGELFLATAKQNADGLVGKMTVSKLRQESGIRESTAQLVTLKILEPVVASHSTKAGFYRAGERLEPRVEEPTDAVGRARALIAQEDAIKLERNKVVEELSAVDMKLALIAKAKEQLAAIEALFASPV